MVASKMPVYPATVNYYEFPKLRIFIQKSPEMNRGFFELDHLRKIVAPTVIIEIPAHTSR